MRRLACVALLLAFAGGLLACTGISGGVYYRRPGYYGPGPWWGWGYHRTVIIDRPDIDRPDVEPPIEPPIEPPVAVPLPEPAPDFGAPDFGPMDMGDFDMGGFDAGGFDF